MRSRSSSPASAPTSPIHDLDWSAPAKYGEGPDLGTVVKEIEALGVRTVAVTGNIGDQAAVEKMKADIEAKLGAVELLVNCAGGDIGAAGGKPVPNNVLGIPLEDIQALTNNNLIGTMLMCQAFVPPMVKAGRGSVVNIGSTAAHMGYSNGAIYATLKAAVVHYTQVPGRRGAGRRRPHQRRQPRPDQDGAVPGDPHRRSGQDGLRRANRWRAMPSRPKSPMPWRSCSAAAAASSPARCCASTAARRSIPADRRALPAVAGFAGDLPTWISGP